MEARGCIEHILLQVPGIWLNDAVTACPSYPHTLGRNKWATLRGCVAVEIMIPHHPTAEDKKESTLPNCKWQLYQLGVTTRAVGELCH